MIQDAPPPPTPDTAAYYYAAYVVLAVLYVGYTLTLWWRARDANRR
jgi:hypothetical protein